MKKISFLIKTLAAFCLLSGQIRLNAAPSFSSRLSDFLHISGLLGLSHEAFTACKGLFACYEKEFEKHRFALTLYTDPRFDAWVQNNIQKQCSNTQKPIVCTSPITQSPFVGAYVTNYIVPKSVHPDRIIYSIHLPYNYQEVVLGHLNEGHICNQTCQEQLNKVISTLDHEYAHIKNNDGIKRFGAELGLLGCSIAISYLARTFVKPKSDLLYGLTPLLLNIPSLLLNQIIQAQEKAADEAIRNKKSILRAAQNHYKEYNNRIANIKQNATAPLSSVQRWTLSLSHEDGNWANPLFAQHPPLNKRIKRLEERITALNALENEQRPFNNCTIASTKGA